VSELVQHPRCPFCRESVAPADAKAACDQCMAWHHAECWGEHGRCSACGAGSALAAGSPAGGGDPAEAGGPMPAGDPATSARPALGPVDRLAPADRALAGYLGHPAARDDVPADAPSLAQAAVDLSGWVAYLARWGDQVVARAALAAGRLAARAWGGASAGGAALTDALAAAEAWLACPYRRHKTAAFAAAEAAEAAGASRGDLAEARAARAVGRAARSVGLRLDVHGPSVALKAVELSAAALALHRRNATQPVPAERAAVRQAISDELLEWLLAA